MRLHVLSVLAVALLTGACTVPLAPGFHIEHEQAQAEYIAGAAPAPRFHAHITYHAVNSGNAPLSVINAVLPNPATIARENLRVTFDGAEAAVQPLPFDSAVPHSSIPFELRLAKPWTEKQRITAEIDFDISAGNNRLVLLAADGFALDNYAWFPRLEAPKHFLAKGEERAAITEISIVVPRDFLALSSGTLLGKKQRGNELEHRFRIRPNDSNPFIVAGRYHQQSMKADGAAVYFWTFSNLSSAAAQDAGRQIAAATAFFDSTFGGRSNKGSSPIWVVESPSPADSAAPPSQSLPNVLVLAPEIIDQGIAHNQVTDAVLRLLAETWTRWSAFPRADERFLGPSLATYAVDCWHESREGESSRRARIADLLRAYDEKYATPGQPAAGAPEKPPAPETHSREKASLFLAALEDQCGATQVRKGMAYSLTALRGREYGYDDLRAGVTSQGCSGLGRTFHEWLDQPGIPGDFRSRYASQTASSTGGNAAPTKVEH